MKHATPSRNAAIAAIAADAGLARSALARVQRGLRRLAAAEAASNTRAAERLEERCTLAMALLTSSPHGVVGLARLLQWRHGTARDVLAVLRQRGLIRLRADGVWCAIRPDDRTNATPQPE